MAVAIWKQGHRDGYKQGWEQGYHMGQCQWAAEQIPKDEGVLWDKKVMFIRADGAPYSTLDNGIADALRGLVRETVVMKPDEDTVGTAAGSRPDLVLVLDAIGQSFQVAKADELRALGIPVAIWLPDDPYHSDVSVNIAPHYDYVFTLELSCVSLYREKGCANVYYLPLGVNPKEVYPRRVEPKYRTDICFVGSAYANRAALFDEAADYLSRKNFKIIGWWWDRMKEYKKLEDKVHGVWLSTEETINHYAGAKIVLNIHRSIDDPYHNQNSTRVPALSVNPRLFEITACGTMQLTDVRQELPNLYTPGVEIATFTSAAEMVEVIEHYLTHENERRLLALRGLYRTLRDHTYRKRLITMMQIIFS